MVSDLCVVFVVPDRLSLCSVRNIAIRPGPRYCQWPFPKSQTIAPACKPHRICLCIDKFCSFCKPCLGLFCLLCSNECLLPCLSPCATHFCMHCFQAMFAAVRLALACFEVSPSDLKMSMEKCGGGPFFNMLTAREKEIVAYMNLVHRLPAHGQKYEEIMDVPGPQSCFKQKTGCMYMLTTNCQLPLLF